MIVQGKDQLYDVPLGGIVGADDRAASYKLLRTMLDELYDISGKPYDVASHDFNVWRESAMERTGPLTNEDWRQMFSVFKRLREIYTGS